MNTVILVGRTTKDIELRRTQSGKSVVSFTLAVNRRGRDAGADFISLVAWEKTAETLAKYVRKGDRIGVEGSISTRSYKDNQGQNRYVTEVSVHSMEFLQDRQDKQQTYQEPQQNFSIDDSDLPF